MMEVINFLNEYNGFVISLLTLILVMATIWYAWVTKRILKVNEQTHLETTRPYVLVSFDGRDNGLEFKVKNFGKTAAYNTTIFIDPPLDDIDMLYGEKLKNFKVGHKPMLNQPFLPPDFEVKTILQYGQEYVTNIDLNRVFEIKIKYQNYEGKTFSTNYKIDISNIVYGDRIMFYSKTYYLNKINENLKSLRDILKKTR